MEVRKNIIEVEHLHIDCKIAKSKLEAENILNKSKDASLCVPFLDVDRLYKPAEIQRAEEELLHNRIQLVRALDKYKLSKLAKDRTYINCPHCNYRVHVKVNNRKCPNCNEYALPEKAVDRLAELKKKDKKLRKIVLDYLRANYEQAPVSYMFRSLNELVE